MLGQIRALRALMGETLEDVRSLSLELRPAVLDSLGLAAALHWLFDRYTQQTGIQVEFATDGLEQRLPRHVETAVYRIVQEALTNVARYANVSSVTVQLYVSEERVVLYVVDSGAGFAAEEAVAGGDSTGLASMRERADLLGGTLTIDSLPGEGTTISAELPISRAIAIAVTQEVDHAGEQILDEQVLDEQVLDEQTRHRARDELRDHARDQWRDAARDARRDTQRDALRDLTRDADRDRARDAAHDTARDAARDASRDAAREATRDATRDALYDKHGTRKESKP
jgi:two-component sensor histidine kinase